MPTRKEIREREKETNFFIEFLKIKRHFFKELTSKLKKVKDSRKKGYVIYGTEVILFTLMLKQAANLTSMRQLTAGFNTETAIHNIGTALGISGLEELPHYDTINNFLEKLEPTELESIRLYMIRSLMLKRCLESHRIVDPVTGFKRQDKKYWAILVDGTGLHTFKKKHCKHCLKQKHTDKETGEVTHVYMHHVLEAKLVVGDMVLSVATEFIENEAEDVKKQDCEMKAFKRLADRLKGDFPKLPICLIGDSIYPCTGTFEICRDYRWKYLCRFKAGRIPSVSQEFEALKGAEKNNAKKAKAGEKLQSLLWVNGIDYNGFEVNVLEMTESSPGKEDRKFVFITDFKVTGKNAQALCGFGRSRWKIENEGFNYQKNVRYEIEHVNSHNYQAMKNHYLLTQITDIIVQLYEKGFKLFKEIKKTAKEKSSNLLEVIRTHKLTDEDLPNLERKAQVRFT